MIKKEIEQLKKRLLVLGAKVEENFNLAVSAMQQGDREAARRCIAADREVDQMEVELEEECLKILALHQPVAKDLRFIVTALKVNNDLERIDDHSAAIARHALHLADNPLPALPFEFERAAQVTRDMLRFSLDSLVNVDHSLALQVRDMDDEVDDINSAMYQNAARMICEYDGDAAQVATVFHAMSVSRCFERIADLSTNIAEDVIYLISGQIVRH